MFSRIGCCIEYEDIDTEQKQSIVRRWYEEILVRLNQEERDFIENTDILDWFLENASRYDNIRILKIKLENAIFDELTETFIVSRE